MLVLTRKVMERIYIGEEVCVTVVRLEGGQVRLGIEAPRHVVVVRGELVARHAPTAPGHRLVPHVPPEGERAPVSPPPAGPPETDTPRRARSR
jgi:carbon storage regulator CsrA